MLRDGDGLKFEMCMDVCGVDYLEHGRAEWKTQHATLSGFSRGVARGMLRRRRGGAAAAVSRSSITFCRSRSISACGLRVFCEDDVQPWWIR